MTTPRISQKPQAVHPERGSEPTTQLSHRYGTIGIQAVAAAARYLDRRKNSAHGAAPRIDQRFVESAG
jgi:hypothetical protein